MDHHNLSLILELTIIRRLREGHNSSLDPLISLQILTISLLETIIKIPEPIILLDLHLEELALTLSSPQTLV